MKVMAVLFLALTVSGSALLWYSMQKKAQPVVEGEGADIEFASAGKGEFVFISGAEVDTLDPQSASWMTDFRALELMFEAPLYVNTETQELEPGTMDRWDVSDDKLTYTLRIRRNARWSNGDPVTSADFIYAWQRAMIPDYASQYFSLMMHIKGARQFFDTRKNDVSAYLYADVKAPAGDGPEAEEAKKKIAARAALDEALKPFGGEAGKTNKATAEALFKKTMADFDSMVGVKAVNDRTIAITLERPTPFFLELLAFATYAPVHKKSVDATVTIDPATAAIIGKAGYFSDPTQAICNGPYYLAEHRFKSHTLFKANPHFWDRANMGNEAIRQIIIEDPNTAILKFQRGEAHWLPDIPTSSSLAADLIDLKTKGKGKHVHLIGGAGTYFYHFNCKPEWLGQKNPLADPRVRRALSMCIDRKKIVDEITRLRQPVAYTMTPIDAIPGYAPPVELGCKFDPDAARKLLAEAGYPEGKGFPQNYKILYNTGAGHETLAQVIQQMWKRELNVDIGLDGVEKNRTMELRRQTQFAVARGGWFGDYRDPTTFLEQHVTGDGHNNSAYANPEFDRYYHEAAKELDPKKRFALLLEAERILTQDQPIAPIYQYTNLHVFDPDKVEHLNPNLWNYRRLNEVRVKP